MGAARRRRRSRTSHHRLSRQRLPGAGDPLSLLTLGGLRISELCRSNEAHQPGRGGCSPSWLTRPTSCFASGAIQRSWNACRTRFGGHTSDCCWRPAATPLWLPHAGHDPDRASAAECGAPLHLAVDPASSRAAGLRGACGLDSSSCAQPAGARLRHSSPAGRPGSSAASAARPAFPSAVRSSSTRPRSLMDTTPTSCAP